MQEILLEVRSLVTEFLNEGSLVRVVNDVSFSLYKGQVLGVVGESGCGKSVMARSILRLIYFPPGKITHGEIFFEGVDLLKLPENEMRNIRGNKIAMIFQEPMTSLNPVYTCGDQIMEAIMFHQNLSKKEARDRAIEMLRVVGIQMPEKRIDCYPHELSGGMRQRVMIAMGLSCQPELLIADEPTTALDPTIQAQILELISDIQKERGMSVIYITHDLGVVAEVCDYVMVMYAGQAVETASVNQLFDEPVHPYTQGLLKAIPRMTGKKERLYNIKGTVPYFKDLPKGCTFSPRCPHSYEKCENDRPQLIDIGSGHCVRCWRVQE